MRLVHSLQKIRHCKADPSSTEAISIERPKKRDCFLVPPQNDDFT